MFVLSGRRCDKLGMFYDKQRDNWTTVAAMMENREKPACAVFESKINISAGRREECCEPVADRKGIVPSVGITNICSLNSL